MRVVAPPSPPPRAGRAEPDTILPSPVLRVFPTAPPSPRFQIVMAPPTPSALAAPIGPATSVGITGSTGTRVASMTPADLTQPGTVYITDFSISLSAGAW